MPACCLLDRVAVLCASTGKLDRWLARAENSAPAPPMNGKVSPPGELSCAHEKHAEMSGPDRSRHKLAMRATWVQDL